MNLVLWFLNLLKFKLKKRQTYFIYRYKCFSNRQSLSKNIRQTSVEEKNLPNKICFLLSHQCSRSVFFLFVFNLIIFTVDNDAVLPAPASIFTTSLAFVPGLNFRPKLFISGAHNTSPFRAVDQLSILAFL